MERLIVLECNLLVKMNHWAQVCFYPIPDHSVTTYFKFKKKYAVKKDLGKRQCTLREKKHLRNPYLS